jgi:hypothetical protein
LRRFGMTRLGWRADVVRILGMDQDEIRETI